MNLSTSVGDSGVTKLAIGGELDVITVTELRAEIEKVLAQRPPRVEVDLSSLRMVDSSGVGALVSLYKRVRAQGGEVIMSGLRDQPLAIFRLRTGEVFATQATCPHKGGPLADGIVGAGKVICPLHAYKFELATGRPLGSDCPALKTYPVRLHYHRDMVVTLP